MASFVSFDVLLQEMDSVESDIWKMFSMRPMPSNNLIDSKMRELVDLIARIPSQYEELIGEWNAKVNKLFNKLTEMSVEKQSSFINVDKVTTDLKKMPLDSGHSVGIDSADRNKNEPSSQTIMPSPLFPFSPSELEKELSCLEIVIEQMFSSCPIPLGEVEVRITEFMDALYQIPTMELQLPWNNKLEIFVQKYRSAYYQGSSSIAQSKDIVGNLQPVDTIASQGMAIHEEQAKPPSSLDISSGSVVVAQEGNGDSKLDISSGSVAASQDGNGESKIKLMERTFGELSQCDLADMTSFRKLLTLTAKAKAFTEHFRGSNRSQLQTKCFSLALAKLPARSQEDFSNEEGKKNLTTLANYLFGLIKADADNREQQQLAQSLGGDEYSNLFNCQYCKKTGHQVTFCPSRKATFCYNCFQFGHSIKRCPAEPLRSEDISRLF